jgi:VCBS repeat-containing protein
MVPDNPLPGYETFISQSKTPPLNVTAGQALEYDVSRHIVDADEDPIRYTIAPADKNRTDWLKNIEFEGSFLKIPEAKNSDTGDYEIHFLADDGHNDPAEFSIKFTVAENHPAHENTKSPLPGAANPLEIKAGKSFEYDLSQHITDDEKDALKYSLVEVKPLDADASTSTEWVSGITFEGSHLKINSAPINGYKSYAIHFTVSDKFDEKSFSLKIQVVPNEPPHENASNPLPDAASPLLIKLGAAGLYDLSSHITDDEQDTLKYTFVQDNMTPDWLKGAKFDNYGSKLTIPAPPDTEQNQTYPISFMVSDGINEQKFSFSVKIAANTAPHENASNPLNHTDSPIELNAGKTLDYDVSTHITDDENDSLKYLLVGIASSSSDASTEWLKGATFSGSHLITSSAPLLSDADNRYNFYFLVSDGINISPFSATLKVLPSLPPYENSQNPLPGHGTAPLTIFQGQSVAYDLSKNFVDPEKDTLTFTLDPTKITAIDGGSTDWFKNAAFDKNGVLTIPAPTTAEVGKHYVINFWMGDGVNASQPYSIPLTIPNRAPTFPKEYPVQLGIDAPKITAHDPDGDTLTYSIIGEYPQGFKINPDTGELSCTDPTKLTNHQYFEFTVQATENKDGGLSAKTLVKVTMNSSPKVNTVEPKPSLLILNSQQPFNYDLTQHYTDRDNDALTYITTDVVAIVPFQGNLSWKPGLSSDGHLTGTPPSGQLSGDYIIRYNVDDQHGGVIQSAIEVRFRGTNDPPVIQDAAFSIKDNSLIKAIVGSVSATDPDGDKLSYSILPESDPKGIFSINADTGVLRVEKPELLNDKSMSAISLTVKADDNWLPSNASKTATVTVNIEHINTMPTAVKDTAATDKNISFLIDVLHNDSDPNGDALHIVKVESSTGKGIVTIEGNNIRYTPGSTFHSLPEGEMATDMFVYTVSDGKLETTAPVLVVINGVNTPPTVSGTEIFLKIQDTDKITPFSSFVISDPDVYKNGQKDPQTMTIQIDKPANGNLISLGGFKNDGIGHYSMTGTADEIQNAVINIVFEPTSATKPFIITKTQFEAEIKNHAAVIPLPDLTISTSSAIPVSEAYPAETVWSCRDMLVPFKGISWADTSSDILGLSIEYGLPIFKLQQFKINDFDFGFKDETETIYEQINRMLREARLLAEIEEVNHADRNAETWRIDIHPIQIR